MKRPTTLIILCLIALPVVFAQHYGWTDISANLPELGGFNDVHFIGDEGWITGGYNKIYYTPDGGATFSIQQLPAGSGISSSVFMKSATEGYAVTFSGKILHYENNKWTTLHEPGGVINAVNFPPDSDTGYTCGGSGTVWSFNDTSITDISPPNNASNLQSIYFPTENNDGKVCGETTIARYKNSSWNNLQLYDATLFYNSIFFINDTTGWAVGTNGTIVLVINGISWMIQTSNTIKNLNDVFFINSQEGWTAGTEVLLHTSDGGTSWAHELESLTPGKELRAIYFTSANNGYVVGNYTVLKYGELTGIEDFKETFGFEISPNPITDKMHITCTDFKTKSGSLEILSIDGKELLKRKIGQGNDNLEIDLSNLKAGIYICKLTIGNRCSVKKIIKQ